MEQQRAHERDRIWAEWMRAANAGDEIAYRRLLEALAPFLGQVVRRGLPFGIRELRCRRCRTGDTVGYPFEAADLE